MRTLWILIFLTVLLPTILAGELDAFRAVYGVWDYSLLGELGFDAVYQEVWWTLGAEKALSKFAEESVIAEEYNLSYICGPYYEVTIPDFEYERAVNANGHVERGTPSRLDPVYWSRLIHEPGLAIANLSLQHPIWGIVWDMEDYLRKEFTYWDYTYDSLALSMFANETGLVLPVLTPKERAVWLRSRQLLDSFHSWEEEKVTEMARNTREAIRAINPRLNLGILAFEDDSWFHLSVLKGFSTDEIPVTAWHEDTYSGYKVGKIVHNEEDFASAGINGKVVPGLWSLWISPFELLNHMEFANRHNGAYWIYQRATNPWVLGTEDEYVEAFRLLHRYVEFNGTQEPNPLPVSYAYPGFEARPNIGPEGVAAILDEGLAFDLGLAFSEPEIMGDYHYVGSNMSVIECDSGSLRHEDLPCFVFGLSEEELEATLAWSAIREVRDLLRFHLALELGELPMAENELALAIEHFEAGRYPESELRAASAAIFGYAGSLEVVWPIVQEGLANPRESLLPVPILNRVYNAKRMFEEGEEAKGRIYLLNALREWCEISEAHMVVLVTLLPILVQTGQRGGGKSG